MRKSPPTPGKAVYNTPSAGGTCSPLVVRNALLPYHRRFLPVRSLHRQGETNLYRHIDNELAVGLNA